MLATGVVPSLKLNATPLSGRLLDAVGAHGTNNVGGRCLEGFLYSKKTRQCKRKTQGCGSFEPDEEELDSIDGGCAQNSSWCEIPSDSGRDNPATVRALVLDLLEQ